MAGRFPRSTTMPRIPYPDPATLPDAMRRVVIENPSNVTRMLAAASESVFKGFAALSMDFMGGSSPLPPKLREIAILRVGPVSNAASELFRHEALARHVGLSEAEIDAVRKGDAAAAVLGEAGAAVLRSTQGLGTNV